MTQNRIIPLLRIFDEDKAKEFYLDFLEFDVDWEHRFEENFPLYMQISRDGWCIQLTGHHGDCCPGASLMLEMDDVKSYQQMLAGKKYKHSRPGCEETEWETIEMTIADPFGNRLTFYQNI